MQLNPGKLSPTTRLIVTLEDSFFGSGGTQFAPADQSLRHRYGDFG